MTQRKHLDEAISKTEAATIAGVSIRTIERYIEDRALTKIKARNGRVTVPRSEVESLTTQVTITPALSSTPTAPSSDVRNLQRPGEGVTSVSGGNS